MTDINFCLWSDLLGDKKLFVPIYWKVLQNSYRIKLCSIHLPHVTGCCVLGISLRALTGGGVAIPGKQTLFCVDLLALTEGLWGKGSSGLAMTYSQRTASSRALEITSISHGVWGSQCVCSLSGLLGEDQHHSSCAEGAGQEPRVQPTGQGCCLLNPHCIFGILLGLSCWAEFGLVVLSFVEWDLPWACWLYLHLKLPIFVVSVARGSCTVTSCWGRSKRNCSLPDPDGSSMLWCSPVWIVPARSSAQVRITVQNHHPWIINYYDNCKLSLTPLPKGKM